MNLWTCTVREVQRRPGRMLLTLLGITLGLATVVATRLTIHTIDRAYRDLFEGVSGRSALEVTAAGQGGFAADFVRDLESAPGVKAVIPRIQGAVALVGDAGSVAVPLLGVEPGTDDWPLCEGRPLAGDREALLDAGLAKNLGLAPGRPMRLWAPAGEDQLDLAGTLRPRGDSAAAGGVLVVSLTCAQHLFALGQHVNSVQILLADDADPNLAQARLAPRLPAGLTIRPPGMRGELGRSTLLAAQQGLASLSIVALIAAAFVILNTFLLNLGERRRQVAVFRALGATRMQVTRLLLRETLLLGLFGTLTGCGAGLTLALLLLRVMGQFLGLSLPPLHLHAEPFVLACVLGP
jgi:putative ABC transport system permease protein